MLVFQQTSWLSYPTRLTWSTIQCCNTWDQTWSWVSLESKAIFSQSWTQSRLDSTTTTPSLCFVVCAGLIIWSALCYCFSRPQCVSCEDLCGWSSQREALSYSLNCSDLFRSVSWLELDPLWFWSCLEDNL